MNWQPMSLLFALILPLSLMACDTDEAKEDDTDTGAVTEDTDTSDTDTTDTETTDTETTDTDTTPQPMDIVDVAIADGRFSILVSAVIDAGLEDTLRSDGDFTVFAPTDDAFTNSGIDLTTLTTEELAEILTYHVIADNVVGSTEIPDLADSVATYTLFFDTTTDVMVNDATVIVPDVEATNGVIHAIDKVLLPPSIADAAGYANLDELLGAVGAADPAVGDALSSPGDFTVFAPTNQAFTDISSVTAGLSSAELTDILYYHVLEGAVASPDVPDMANTAAGYTLFIDDSAGVAINGSPVAIADIVTTNGIVHVVEDVLIPPTVLDAAGYAGLSELAAVVGGADPSIADLLSSPGDLTVFAPDNAAFTAAAGTLSGLSAAEIDEALAYHVVSGVRVDSTSVPPIADSAAGYTLFFDTSAGVAVNNSPVAVADIYTTNGIVHVVEDVLLPPTIVDAAGYAGLNELAAAVGNADPIVATLLSSPGAYTVFAPTDQAFVDVSSVTAGLTMDELTDVLTYHVLTSEVDSGSVPPLADSLLSNPWGDPVTLLFDTSAGVAVNGAPVVIADVKTTNGTVHVIESVLLPPNVVDLAGLAGLTDLLDTVGAATGDLGTTLSGPGPFTVFAPTNDAFTAAAPITATLTPEDLENVLLYHVVDSLTPVTSADLMAGPAPTLFGQTVDVNLTGGVFVNGAEVIIPDVHGTNGTVHVVDGVLVPTL